MTQRAQTTLEVELGVGSDDTTGLVASAFGRGIRGIPVPCEQRGEQAKSGLVQARSTGRRDRIGDNPTHLHHKNGVRTGRASHRTVNKAWSPPGDREGPQQVRVEGQAGLVLAARQGAQRAHQQQVLLEAAVIVGHFVGGFDHRGRCRVTRVVRSDCSAISPQGFGLGDDVEGTSLKELHVGDHKRLETGAELRCGATHTLRHRPNFAVLATEHGHDPIGFAQLVGPKHNGFITVKGHLSSIPRARQNGRRREPTRLTMRQRFGNGLSRRGSRAAHHAHGRNEA